MRLLHGEIARRRNAAVFFLEELREMSVDGKVRALSKLLRDNLGLVMQGVGDWLNAIVDFGATNVSAESSVDPSSMTIIPNR